MDKKRGQELAKILTTAREGSQPSEREKQVLVVDPGDVWSETG